MDFSYQNLPIKFDKEIFDTALKSWQQILSIFDIPVILWEYKKKKSWTLNQIFAETSKNNYHSICKPCTAIENGTCKYGNLLDSNSNHIYATCTHFGDSLQEHLKMACIINGCWAIKQGYPIKIVQMAMFAGLFHDIGKISTLNIVEQKDYLHVSFPAHAELSSIIIKSMWSYKYTNVFSYKEWLDICDVISKHMCGYHYNRTTPQKINMLRLEKKRVRNLLKIMSVGDHWGALPIDRPYSEEQYFEFHKHFSEEIDKDFDRQCNDIDRQCNDIDRQCNDIDRQHVNHFDKLIIYLIGLPNSGKTYLAKMIENRFQNTKYINLIDINSINKMLKDSTIKVIIIDTNLSPGCLKKMMPKEIKHNYIIHIHINNFTETGTTSLFTPLHKNYFNIYNLYLLSSVYSDKIKKNSFRPNYVMNISRTVNGNIGYEDVFKKLHCFLEKSKAKT
jgi:hypothetical protein